MSLAFRAKALKEFIPADVRLQGDPSVQVTGMSADSRQIRSGNLFVAHTGVNKRGSEFIGDACERGAVAVLTDDEQVAANNSCSVPVAFLPELKTRLSAIAGDFYENPSARLAVTGVTGTNGKTSCCYWYAWLSNQLGKPCGQIGTLGAGYLKAGDVKNSAQSLPSTGMTTPDAVRVQSLLAEIDQAGASAAIMEVSSHGLDQGRVEAVQFEAAIFTNLTQDHLDYHASMEDYFAAKASLFVRPELQRVILNRDDQTYDRLNAGIQPGVQSLSYSLRSADADLFLESLNWVPEGAAISLGGRWGRAETVVPLIGEYNLANMLAVLTALLAAGFGLLELAEVVSSLPPVPGRMQLMTRPGLPRVVVDYAHTPDAVTNALGAVRSQTQGRLIAVLGCGGDRDKSKRPLMAQAAFAKADHCWFTSDNPRSEDPASIVDDMMVGLDLSQVAVEVRRDLAIEQSILNAGPQDLVLVLGKGHETYQEIQGVRHPFSDAEYCERALDKLQSQGRPAGGNL